MKKDEELKLTAKEMHHAPARAYRAADKGQKVTINHDRYPDRVFKLTAVDKQVVRDENLRGEE